MRLLDMQLDGRGRMGDLRLERYARVTHKMISGDYRVVLPLEISNDDIDTLGASLIELGQALEQRFEEQRLLQQITERINAGFVLDEVLDHVYDVFRHLIPYHRIGCALLEGETLRTIWARTEGDGPAKLAKGYAARLSSTSLGQVAQAGRPRILNDLEAYLRSHPHSQATRKIVEEGMRSSLTCPLASLGKTVGFLFFSSRIRGAYHDTHVSLFEQIAGQIAIIVEKSRLYERLLRTKADLELANARLEVANSQLQALAVRDGLTGIANRRHFDAQLRKEWRRARRTQKPLALLLCDLDHFKALNDSAGHQHGDSVLRDVARTLALQTHRAGDLVARYGGEEFAVLLTETDAAGAATVAERIRDQIQRLNLRHPNSPSGQVTCTVGVAATVPDDSNSTTMLIEAADQALYLGKRTGRNRVARDTDQPSTVSAS